MSTLWTLQRSSIRKAQNPILTKSTNLKTQWTYKPEPHPPNRTQNQVKWVPPNYRIWRPIRHHQKKWAQEPNPHLINKPDPPNASPRMLRITLIPFPLTGVWCSILKSFFKGWGSWVSCCYIFLKCVYLLWCISIYLFYILFGVIIY